MTDWDHILTDDQEVVKNLKPLILPKGSPASLVKFGSMGTVCVLVKDYPSFRSDLTWCLAEKAIKHVIVESVDPTILQESLAKLQRLTR